MTAAGRVIRFTDTAFAGTASQQRLASIFPGARIDIRSMTLREIFVALARHTRRSEEVQ
jgi:hypothetical protein